MTYYIPDAKSYAENSNVLHLLLGGGKRPQPSPASVETAIATLETVHLIYAFL